MSEKSKNIKVVVLGDIGRSPRMQYHALSLAESGHKVDIIGYGETEPSQAIKSNTSILYHYLAPVPQIPYTFIHYIFKTIWQAVNLLFLLLVTSTCDCVIVQNPPAIPALVVCWIYARITRCKFIIDWHNYAHTIMALSAGEETALVRITMQVESFIGRRADQNFCVTKAMKYDLKENWQIEAVALYDRPPVMFRPISLEEKHKFLSGFCGEVLRNPDGSTRVTHRVNGQIQLRPDRVALMVSSTSWTDDEDFSILLSALQTYDDHCLDGNVKKLPALLCIITGKGPLKKHYLDRIVKLDWKHCLIMTPWLSSTDYPLMLASADLGVCLHKSSSGLDLPMKVVDMFGCGVPVCAYDYKCINELVKNGENGFTFKTHQQLSDHIMNWFEGFPNNEKHKETEKKFKADLETFQALRWKENWNLIAGPAFD